MFGGWFVFLIARIRSLVKLDVSSLRLRAYALGLRRIAVRTSNNSNRSLSLAGHVVFVRSLRSLVYARRVSPARAPLRVAVFRLRLKRKRNRKKGKLPSPGDGGRQQTLLKFASLT